MIPYTTTKHVFRFWFSAEMFAKARITYQQNDEIMVEKSLSDCSKSGNSLILVLGVEDTSKFKNKINARVQIHYETIDGVVDATLPRTVTVGEILKREVL